MRRLPILFLALSPILLRAEINYQKPPQAILDVMHAPAAPVPSISPTKTHILLIQRQLYPSISVLAAPVHRIAGLRINPANNGPHAPLMTATGLVLKKIDGGAEVKIVTPTGARLDTPVWSPDGKHFAVTNSTPTSIELYVGSIASPALRKIPGVILNDTIGEPVVWFSSSTELLVRMVPSARGPAPKAPAAPAGPNVQESSGQAGPVRTYQDMLKSPYDEQLFDYYCTSQLASVDVATGRVARIGTPGIFASATPSPDGKHLLVARVHKPYSYLHAYRSFPQETEVWDRTGHAAYHVFSHPLEDRVPIEGVPTGRRNIGWRPTEGATLLWWEALDGGDPKAKAPYRDKLMMLRAPFTGQPTEVFKTQHRARGLLFGETGGLALVSDYDRDRRWLQMFRIYLDDPSAQAKLVSSRNAQDRYKDPGQPLMKRLPTGGMVLQQSGDYVFLAGTGATPQGDRPFLDRLNLRTWATEHLFRAGDQGYESVVGLLNSDGTRFLTSYETPTTPPNLYIRQQGSDTRTAVTSFEDPTPILRKIKRQLVTYKRDDGVQLSFTLFLPPDYQPGTRLPTIIWAYPLEYNDADTAGQVGGSTQRFVQMRGISQLFLLLGGYAILNDATIPIVGDPETVNNTYLEQLVAGAKAAIDKAVEMGVTDRNRVGVGGHSYGAFMTANLLAHSNLFRAGVARSGAYNRTLTPFGFQSERRTFWQARDTYMKMSPFTYADQIKTPILLIHGEADNNPGTFPINSERLYQAIRGHGGTVRLVMLPFESHGYAARESSEHTVWEMLTWFDKYVKNAPAQASSR
ncbi:prolyl oligopeptidase family serine peptidase [uncultured Paludibaculum sp.]|uniref:S9 family peptidase n=1 Tax=uncultured Paludibaculum sp. TaxID=1765020 RepID=UPI002AAA6FBE|nr:prolyl oligopeptidase family serine peptidase [uncultured Paludibaculum sp.]